MYITKVNMFSVVIFVNFVNYLIMPYFNPGIPYNYILLFFLTVIFYSSNEFKPIILKRECIFISIIAFSLISLIYSPYKSEGLEKIISLILIYLGIYKYGYYFSSIVKLNGMIKVSGVMSIIYLSFCFFTYNEFLYNATLYQGTTGNQHNSSIIIAMCTLFLIVYFFKSTINIVRLISLGFIIYSITLQISTFARVGFIIIFFYALFSMFFFFMTTTNNNRLIVIVTFLLGVFLFFVTFLDLIVNVMGDFFIYVGDKGMSGRDDIIFYIIDSLKSNLLFLIMGFGVGSVYLSYDDLGMSLKDSGSIFSVLYEGGLILLIIWMLLIFKYLYTLFRIYKIKSLDISVKLYLTIPVALIFNFTDAMWINYSTFETVILFTLLVMSEKILNNSMQLSSNDLSQLTEEKMFMKRVI